MTATTKQAADVAREILGGCTCLQEFKGRGLLDPHCDYCAYSPGIISALETEREWSRIEVERIAKLHNNLCERFAEQERKLAAAHAAGRAEMREVVEAASDLVTLWQHQKVEGLPRAERNAAIEETRDRLIVAVKALPDASTDGRG